MRSQQVLVVGFRRESPVATACAQRFVGGMGQKAVAEVADRLLDGAAQPFADARARVERILVIALDQAFGGRSLVGRQASGVQQPVEDGEVGKETVGEDAVQVELEVGELDQPGAVAQQAQHAAVGDQAVELLVQVQELLHQRVGRHAQGGILGLAVEPGRFAIADDLDRASARGW